MAVVLVLSSVKYYFLTDLHPSRVKCVSEQELWLQNIGMRYGFIAGLGIAHSTL